MENDPLNQYNKKIFSKLFESKNDQDEKLYKNTFLEFDEKKQDLNENISNLNLKELTHNSLLKRISMEDYILFPPKNESNLKLEEGNLIEKEEPEKLFEEEVDFLQKINKINYLTFSPFGENFFPNKKKKDNKKNSSKEKSINKKKENEDKLLDLLEFEYDNYVINNDLLFNISMGYIDLKKLKKENAVSSDKFISKKERIKQEKKKELVLSKMKKKNFEKGEFKYEVAFKQDLFNSLQELVTKYKEEEFFNNIISEFNKDMDKLKEMEKNSEKNKILLKWEKEFKEQQFKYHIYLQKKERRERKESQLQKEMEKKLNKEKNKDLEKQKQFEDELNKIRTESIKRNSIKNNKKHSGNKSAETSLNKNNKKKLDNKIIYNKKSKVKRIKTISNDKKISGYKSNRISWPNTKNDYAFGNI